MKAIHQEIKAISRRHDKIWFFLQSSPHKKWFPFFWFFWKSNSSEIFIRVDLQLNLKAISQEMKALSRLHYKIWQFLQTPSQQNGSHFIFFWKSNPSETFIRVNLQSNLNIIRQEMKTVSRRYDKIWEFLQSPPPEKNGSPFWIFWK